MVTATPFCLPQSLAKPSIHLSYCGIKWLHCRIFKVLFCARAVDTNGAATAGAKPAAPAAAPTVFRNCRRVAMRPRRNVGEGIVHSLMLLAPGNVPASPGISDGTAGLAWQ